MRPDDVVEALRLHKARGYGALKAILEILAEEEPLTLTEVAHRLHRTPGSTKATGILPRRGAENNQVKCGELLRE